jgi:F-type H+/Na+-transporting ATPase subunit alpha
MLNFILLNILSIELVLIIGRKNVPTYLWRAVVPILERDFVRETYPTGVISADAAVPVGRG